MEYTIDAMRRHDWAQVRAIYAQGLATGTAAFLTTPPKWMAWNDGHLQMGRIVARNKDGQVLGWSALAPVPDT